MFGTESVIAGMTLRPREQLPPFPPGLFFKVGICVAGPFVPSLGISLHKLRGWTLYGESHLFEQLAHMAGMITHSKFLFNDLRNDW